MKNFFEKIDFTFGGQDSDITPCEIIISENTQLTKKLKGNVYIFNGLPQTHTSFYVITIPLEKQDLFELKRYIWNENKYDLYFIADNLITTTLFYAKTNPREPEIKIKSFKLNAESNELEEIKKWKFNSGAFWLSYRNTLEKIKKIKKIDVTLIEQLKQLKLKLQNELKNKDKDVNKVVQALIDRTLFIKFLEDNHILNLDFYSYHFKNRNYTNCYKDLLKNHDISGINKLFSEINKIFNNILFKTPFIKEECLNTEVLQLILDAISQYNWENKQLSLFDFRFNVIPTEFISHIYEVFLENYQLGEGIYYTPTKLVDLIIDDTITGSGSVLDPACGSGMFLVVAFRKILELNPPKQNISVYEKIAFKNKLLQDYIYGIEKNDTAWRLAIFSLYLEILKGFSSEEIQDFVKKFKSDFNLNIFPHDFSKNILNHNSLEIAEDKIPHKGKAFDYIVGNPPFFGINPQDTDKEKEIKFINNYSIQLDDRNIKASEVIGYKQISQAFMLKIKDWAKPETRFGFVLNSSNFYNEKSKNFHKFFFEYYQIESFYELSRVKDILFRKSGESVIVAIFNNKKIENNNMGYYPVDMEIFSETFDLLIIQEDKKIDFSQEQILNETISLRDHLIGNKHDIALLHKLSDNKKLEDFLLKDSRYNSLQGLTRKSNKFIISSLGISENEFNSNKKTYQKLYETRNYLSKKSNVNYTIPYIYDYTLISEFKLDINNIDGYININSINDNYFQRARSKFIFEGKNIIFCRMGKRVKAVFCNYDKVFSVDIFGIKLDSDNYYYLVTAILNSDLINYYISVGLRQRPNDSFPKLHKENINNIPIPKFLDEDLASEISEISQQLTEGKLKYESKLKEKLNNLIFDLYDLGYLDKQRIKEYFATKDKVEVVDLEHYATALLETLEIYFEIKPKIEYYQDKALGFNIIVTVVYFNDSYQKIPSSKKVFEYIISKILKESNEKFLAMREKIFGKDCIYIIRDNKYKNWSISKAFEDGKEILKLVGL